MPRATWSGAISFGLINIPVKLYSAITHKSVRFNQLDPSNNARVRNRRVNAETGEEVSTDDLVRGFEVSKGNYVQISDDELASLQPKASHTIDLEEFVDLDQIDPIYFDGANHVAPGVGAEKAYSLLVSALEKSGKVAIARVVMRSKQHVAVMRPVEGRLLMSMMVYDDEINSAEEIPEFDTLGNSEVSDRELDMAEQLIESLSADFQPSKYHDTYREELLDLIDQKASGATPVLEAPSEPTDDVVVDIMAALEKSVEDAREKRGRKGSRKSDREADVEPAAETG
jgi:DNA end-binding protein Ku